MDALKHLSPFIAAAGQLQPADMGTLAAAGFRSVINNRPDGKGEGQPSCAEMQAAALASGLEYVFLPVTAGQISDEQAGAFTALLNQVRGSELAFCRTGTRFTPLRALSEAHHLDPQVLLKTAQNKGYDLSGLAPRLQQRWPTVPVRSATPTQRDDIVIVGGGAAGCAVTVSLLRRDPHLRIAIVEPSGHHYYQPGWTLVGAGIFDRARTERPMARCIPHGAQWRRAAVAGVEPEQQCAVLEDRNKIGYRALIVCPGLSLYWDAVEGLKETLGHNGVTSNYQFEQAPYTWQLLQHLRKGRALFTPPPMPINCAGAAQKALYLSRDWWQKHAVPSQRVPEFIHQSSLANAEGWVEADHDTLRRPRVGNIFSLGDVCASANAKTAAAVRKQAPVIAENVISVLAGKGPRAVYDGYGSSPLTVERGNLVLAEFGCGGKLLPTFPLNPAIPRRLAWALKVKRMPSISFDMMLHGREWLAAPKRLQHEPAVVHAAMACDFAKGQAK
jgi:uncharacterized protein (TIGR01244 family)